MVSMKQEHETKSDLVEKIGSPPSAATAENLNNDSIKDSFSTQCSDKITLSIEEDLKGAKEEQMVIASSDEIRGTPSINTTLKPVEETIELRLLVRRREAGALIGKRGSNIKRLRDSFRSSMFSIPDTGNGPERVVCIATDADSLDPILNDITELLMEKSPENDEQIELKLLIHSSHAGSIIGIGGQSIKKLRNDSKAAIKIYEMCCPLSNERVCAIKAKPPVVVSTMKLIQSILNENPVKGTIKPYDALHFDLNLVDKYGGYLPEDQIASSVVAGLDMMSLPPYHRHEPYHHHHHHHHQPQQQQQLTFNRQMHEAVTAAAAAAATASGYSTPKHFSLWRQSDLQETCKLDVTADSCNPNKESIESSKSVPSNENGDQLAKIAMNNGNGAHNNNNLRMNNHRFHPYINPNQLANLRPALAAFNRAPRAYYPYNQYASRFGCFPFRSQQQAATRFSQTNPMSCDNLGPNFNRCGHITRPCICMLLPAFNQPDVQQHLHQQHQLTAQMAKNLNYQKSYTHEFKKK